MDPLQYLGDLWQNWNLPKVIVYIRRIINLGYRADKSMLVTSMILGLYYTGTNNVVYNRCQLTESLLDIIIVSDPALAKVSGLLEVTNI